MYCVRSMYATKIRLRENLTSEIFYRRKFPDLRYILNFSSGKYFTALLNFASFADKFSWSIASSRSIWAAEGSEGVCNSGAIEIQIHVRNWAWQYVYVYGLGHSNRRTISKYGEFSAWISISMAPGRTRQLHAPSPLICSSICYELEISQGGGISPPFYYLQNPQNVSASKF
jgi:hypothetical protein